MPTAESSHPLVPVLPEFQEGHNPFKELIWDISREEVLRLRNAGEWSRVLLKRVRKAALGVCPGKSKSPTAEVQFHRLTDAKNMLANVESVRNCSMGFLPEVRAKPPYVPRNTKMVLKPRMKAQPGRCDRYRSRRERSKGLSPSSKRATVHHSRTSFMATAECKDSRRKDEVVREAKDAQPKSIAEEEKDGSRTRQGKEANYTEKVESSAGANPSGSVPATAQGSTNGSDPCTLR